jgi:hypothetical protein
MRENLYLSGDGGIDRRCSAPEGHRDNSPALQRWEKSKKMEPVPEGRLMF